MTIIRRASPLGDLLSLRSAMDRLFDDTFFRPIAGTREETLAMPLDIYATDDALVVEAALPGVKPEDVDVSILGDTLTLTATSARDTTVEKSGYHVREVRRGRFSRTITLPGGLTTDAATATFEHGMLTLAFPRAEQVKPRQIPVMAPTEGSATAIDSVTGDAPPTPTAGEQPAAG